MKTLLILLLLSLPISAFAAVHYDLDIQLLPAEQQLVARTRIDLDGATVPLKLQLSPRCEIDRILQGEKPVDYRFANGVLQLEAEGTAPISISYHAIFNDQTQLHNEDPTYGISASISPKGSYLSSGVNWYPRLPGSRVNYRIRITAPAGTEAITSGRRIERTLAKGRSSSVWRVDYPLSGLTLSAGAYELFEDLSGPVPIYAYFYADSAPLAASYLQAARGYLQLYEKMFGPYPFHKFAIVENFFPTGYGLPSWTLLGSSVIKLPFIVKTSLGHEIAHSWWGSGVQVDDRQGNWAEGLTTYVADYLYKERSSEAEARDYRRTILRDYANLVGPENDFPLSRFGSRYDKASQVIGYGKAALLFHMLRKRIGDQLFWSGLRKLAQERMYSRVGWDDFAALFSTLSGQKLQAFFRPWLTGTAGPQLALQGVTLARTETGWRVSGRLTQQPVYPMAIELQLTTATGSQSKMLQLDSTAHPFHFDSPTRPLSLEADPDSDLFRILSTGEIPATVNSIRGSDRLLMLRAERYVPDAEAIKTLVAALAKTDRPVRTLSEVGQEELAKQDLLIFGLADRLHPALLQQNSAAQLSLADQRLSPTADSAFIVEPHPLNGARSAAWFISQAEQAALVARKIPHYGKYSYLMFNGISNRLKGIHPPAESPLRVVFNSD